MGVVTDFEHVSDRHSDLSCKTVKRRLVLTSVVG